MLQPTPTRGAATWIGGVYEDKQRRKLVVAVLILLAAITAVLVRDYESGSANNQSATDNASEPAYAPATAGPAPVVQVAAAQTPVVTTPFAKTKTSSSQTHSNARLAASSVKHERPVKSSATWASATIAAQRTSDQVQAHQPAPSYPLLTEASAVRGSVLLQTLIGADGAVQEMRVISGPTILVSAARQAVQQWRFKPYLVNGKAVETYARVTVNFSIDVSNTEARIHLNSVTSTGAL
jgi:TonB family protein